MTIRSITSILVLLLGTAGCVRRDGRNANCVWPGESGARRLNINTDGPHLSADAEFAEELADAYALKQAQGGNLQKFILARQQCMEQMFAQVSMMHGVTSKDLTEHLGANRALIDIVLNLPFILLYVWASSTMVRRIFERCPPPEQRVLGTLLILICSLAFGVMGVLLGEMWSQAAEAFRVGSGHLGIRVNRLPFALHRAGLSLCLVALFCVVAAVKWLLLKQRTQRTKVNAE